MSVLCCLISHKWREFVHTGYEENPNADDVGISGYHAIVVASPTLLRKNSYVLQ
jgi:hypothetical protein